MRWRAMHSKLSRTGAAWGASELPRPDSADCVHSPPWCASSAPQNSCSPQLRVSPVPESPPRNPGLSRPSRSRGRARSGVSCSSGDRRPPWSHCARQAGQLARGLDVGHLHVQRVQLVLVRVAQHGEACAHLRLQGVQLHSQHQPQLPARRAQRGQRNCRRSCQHITGPPYPIRSRRGDALRLCRMGQQDLPDHNMS